MPSRLLTSSLVLATLASLPQVGVCATAQAPAATPTTVAAPTTAAAPTGASPLQIGYQMLALGDYPKAIRVLLAALRSNPNDVAARRYLAHALVRSGSNSMAVEQFGVVEQLQPLEATDQAALGDAQRSLGNLKAAVAAYTKAVESDPQLEVGWAGLARTYAAAGQHQQAVALLKHGMTKASSKAGWTYLVGVYMRLDEERYQPSAQPSGSEAAPTGESAQPISRSR